MSAQRKPIETPTRTNLPLYSSRINISGRGDNVDPAPIFGGFELEAILFLSGGTRWAFLLLAQPPQRLPLVSRLDKLKSRKRPFLQPPLHLSLQQQHYQLLQLKRPCHQQRKYILRQRPYSLPCYHQCHPYPQKMKFHLVQKGILLLSKTKIYIFKRWTK